MIFGWVLSWIGLDDMVLELLEQIFNTDFTMVAYYVFFGLIGLATYIYHKFTNIITRD
jgi:hypothetical protein